MLVAEGCTQVGSTRGTPDQAALPPLLEKVTMHSRSRKKAPTTLVVLRFLILGDLQADIVRQCRVEVWE